MPEPLTILIIEDSALSRTALRDDLAGRGFKVLTAENGKEGLSLIQSKRPDVVLMDVVMPIMDGWETCHQVRAAAELREIPIIITTTKNTSQDMMRAFEVGANQFMEKPLDVDLLVKEIHGLAARRLDGAPER